MHSAMSKNLFVKQKSAYICIICGLVAVLLVACGGERTTPTPLPADIVRPVQPTPVYQTSANFILATATPPTTTVASRVPLSPTELMTATASVTGMQTASTTLSPPAFIPQTPTALGIATGGAVLQATPGGRALVNLPAGATVIPLTVPLLDDRLAEPEERFQLVITEGFSVTVLDSSAKYLSQHYPVAMVVWARYVFHVLVMLLVLKL